MKIFESRKKSMHKGDQIDWSTAEALAFGSLLEEGYTSVDSEEVLNPIEAKLTMKIPRNQ